MSNDVKEQLDCSSLLERTDATWVFYKTPKSSFSFLLPTYSHDWCHWLQSVRRRYKWTFMMHVFVCSSKLSHRHSASKASRSGAQPQGCGYMCHQQNSRKTESAFYPANENVDICMNLDVQINQLSGGKRRLEIVLVVACRL